MSTILYEPYFEPEALANLRLYRYSAVDKSLVYNYVLRHWSDLAVKAFPMWMAPNLITLSGFGFIAVNVLTLAIYIPNLIDPGPSWIYLSFAVGLFLYQTFDNVDGKQARRTGSSSALGHVFDHTIDSLNCALGGLLQVASLSVGPCPKALFLTLVGCAAMWFSTWEEYHTGTLYLGYFNGPTEGVLIACVIHLISFAFGPQIWLRQLNSFSFLKWAWPQLKLQDVVAFMALFSLVAIHVPECIMNVHKTRQASSQALLPTLAQHAPFLLYVALANAWALSPASIILLEPPQDTISPLIEFTLVLTFSFGKLNPRVILGRLTRQPFPGFKNNFSAFAPLAIGAAYVNICNFATGFHYNPRVESLLLHIASLLSTASFLHWSYHLILSFTRTLHIGCFTLKPRGDGRVPLAHLKAKNSVDYHA